MDYLKDLNHSQFRAVTHPLGVLRILAGPGSGKTRVLTTRIAHLVRQQGINPRRCRAITFTRSATKEMKDRLYGLGVEGVEISTIHALARELINRFYSSHPDLKEICKNANRTAPICWIDGMNKSDLPVIKHNKDETSHATPEMFLRLALGHLIDLLDQKVATKEIPDTWERAINMTDRRIEQRLGYKTKARFWQQLTMYVSLYHLKKYVNSVLGQEFYAEFAAEDFTEIKSILKPMLNDYAIDLVKFLEFVACLYKKVIEGYGLIDYTGQLIWAHAILRQDENTLTAAQDLYDVYFVDEFQDTDPVQTDTLRLLTEQSQNITVVGDPNQAIYGFRGADVKGIQNFENTFPSAETISLEVNYRSTHQIIEASYKVVGDYQDENWVKCKGLKEGIPVRFIQKLNEVESYPSDLVVLTRTNKGAKEIGDELKRLGILYKVRTQDYPTPYLAVSKLHITPVLDVIRGAENPNDTKRLLGAIQHVKGVGKQTLESFQKYPQTPWEHPKTAAFRKMIIPDTPTVEEIRSSKIFKLNVPKNFPKNVFESDTQYMASILAAFEKCPTFDEILESTTLEIRTIHSAKGLEWKNVVVDLIGFKPYDNSEEELAEECRVLYVAMSRAEERLYLLGDNRYDFPNLDALQRFLRKKDVPG